jgi:DNA-binding LacI/PurR family transcriptional regulator
MTPGASAARPPTILDVAHRADVSKSTVSNVIRGGRGVAAAKRARVLEAIESLGYRPNILARQLVQRRTTILGVVVGDLGNPFHAEMAKQVERHASAHGYHTMFCSAQADQAAELSGIQGLLEYRVAGILFLAHAGASSRARELVEGVVPSVFVTCSADWGDVVSGDDQHGAEMATRHLIELGHQRIAYFADPTVEDAADRARQVGYSKVMRQAGLSPIVYSWRHAPDTVVHNKREMPVQDVLRGPRSATAIFSSNDLGAIELLDVADRLGVNVPDDLSLVGFDNVLMAGLSRINLTTVAQPQEQLARLSVATLAARVQGELTGDPVRRTVDLELVVRGSTAMPRVTQRKAG